MPTKIERLKLKIGKENDRRVKYGDFEKSLMKTLYEKGWSIRGITREIGCSRRLVQFVLFPERSAHAKELQKERGSVYYSKEKHREYIRRYRQHLKEVWNNKIL